MTRRPLGFRSGSAVLTGELVLPEELPAPAVLLIAGSGPIDRDENHRRIRLNVLNTFAEHLVDHGVASLRFDKRGVGESEGDFWTTGLYDELGDAATALENLKSVDDIDRGAVFVLGHSVGALHAVELARRDRRIAGAVLLSTIAMTGEEVLRWQAAQIEQSLQGFQRRVVDLLGIDVMKSQRKRLEKIKQSSADSLRMQLVAKVNARWLREFMAYDPTIPFVDVRVPMLAITGAKDIQVDPADLDRLAAIAQTEFEHHVIPDLTHILRRDPGPPTLSTYKEQTKEPVDEEIIELVLRWLQQRLEATR